MNVFVKYVIENFLQNKTKFVIAAYKGHYIESD